MAKTLSITLSNADLRVLEHDLLDPELWIREAVAAKIASCAKRMILDTKRTLENDPTVDTMPTKPLQLLAAYVARPDYKNRAARDAEEATQRAKG